MGRGSRGGAVYCVAHGRQATVRTSRAWNAEIPPPLPPLSGIIVDQRHAKVCGDKSVDHRVSPFPVLWTKDMKKYAEKAKA